MSYSLDAIYQTSSWAIAKNSFQLASLQQKAATGLNVLKVSDDPSTANMILALQDASRQKEQFIGRLDEAIGILDLSASVIQSISGELARARASLTATLSGTTNMQLRSTLAADLDHALEQLVALCNTERLGQYLFAGVKSTQPPYRVERDAQGRIRQVIYQGGDQEQKLQIATNMQMSALLVGDQLFRADQIKPAVFYGNTGARAGSGTHSVRGDVYLQVEGTPGNWRLSIDGGASWVVVPATGAENVPVVHSQTGQTLYVDASNITQTGIEPIRLPGTYDLFNVLIGVRDALYNTQGLINEQVIRMISDASLEIQDVEAKLVRAFPIVGGRMQILSSLRDTLDQMKANADQEISRLHDADVTQISIDLARYSALYEMSLQIAAKLFKMSLLDFIQ